MPDRTAARSSIVLVVDGLGASLLGPYGNTWCDSPGANRLAAESLLLEQVMVESPDLAVQYQSYWRGRRALQPHSPHGAEPNQALAEQLQRRGVETALVTDEPEIAELADAAHFARRIAYAGSNQDAAAEDALSTQLGQLLAAAYDAASLPAPFCLWIHAQGLGGLWDAPWPMRAELADEDDPDPPFWVAPPSRQTSPQDDPDTVLGWMYAAAAQVRLLDQFLDMLRQLADARRALLVLTAPRGYPLGEHGVVGWKFPRLYSELLHVPLMVRRPDGEEASCRTQQLAQGRDVHRIVCGWHALGPAPQYAVLPDPARQLAVSACQDQLAIRTQSWFARLAEGQLELYVKPDDRGEVNEVADRCEPQAEAMQRLAESVCEADEPPIDPLLWQPHY